MTNQDGGSAFPVRGKIDRTTKCRPPENFLLKMEGGMTLRDYFAASAISGILSRPYTGPKEDFARDSTVLAGLIADAMLAERSEKGARA